jgi:hypothetical protein
MLNQVDLDALKKRLTVASRGSRAFAGISRAESVSVRRSGRSPTIPTRLHCGLPSPNRRAWIRSTPGNRRDPSNNPNAAGIFAKALGADIDNLGKNVFFGTDASGKTVAYQVGPDGNPHILDFSAAGVTPNDPIKVVDTGGSQVIVGSSGAPRRILPKTARPDTIINANTSRDNNIRTNQTNLTIAGMPARPKGDGKAPGGDDGNVPNLLDNIEQGFNDLHRMNALAGRRRRDRRDRRRNQPFRARPESRRTDGRAVRAKAARNHEKCQRPSASHVEELAGERDPDKIRARNARPWPTRSFEDELRHRADRHPPASRKLCASRCRYEKDDAGSGYSPRNAAGRKFGMGKSYGRRGINDDIQNSGAERKNLSD